MVDLPRLPRRVATVEEPRSRLSGSDIAAPFAHLARSMDFASDALMEVAEPLAEKEGVKSVRTGDDGQLVIDRSPLPIVGKAGIAYERAAKGTYLARVQPEIDAAVLKMRLENPNDPDGFKKTSESYLATIVGNAEKTGGPVLGEAVRRHAEATVSQNYRTALVSADNLNVQNALVAFKSRLTDLDNAGAALARQGGTDTPEYRKVQEDTLAIYQELGVDARFKYPADRADREVAEMVSRHRGEAIIGGMLGVFNKATPTAAAEARKFLVDSAWDPKLNLSPAQRHTIVTRGMAELEGRTGETKAMIETNRNLTKQLIEGLKGDAPYDSRVVGDALQRSAEIGDTKSYYDLTFERAMKDGRDAIKRLPLPQAIATVRGLQAGEGTFEAMLIGRESSRVPTRVNELGYAGLYQFGAPRLQTIGLYTPGAGEDLKGWSTSPKDAPGKWSGTFNIPGHPGVKTMQDFLANPEAQRAAFVAHRTRMDEEIKANGFDRFEGKLVGGVPITREGLYGMMHLGGPESTRAALESDGKINPKDKNGTTVLDYARLGRAPLGTVPGDVFVETVRQGLVNDLKTHFAGAAEKLVEGAEKTLGKGIRLSDEEVKNIAEVIQVTGRAHDLGKRMEIAVGGFDGYSRLTGQPIALRNAWRAALQAEVAAGVDPFDRKVVDATEETVKRVQADMKDKPYTTGAVRGLHVAPYPMNVDDPAVFAAAVRQRSAMDRVHQKVDGLGPRSVFEPGEAEALRGALISGKPEQIAALFQGLQQLEDAQLVATLEAPAVKDGVRNAMRTNDPARYGVIMSSLDQLYARAPESFTRLLGEDAWHELKTWQSNLRYLDPKVLAAERARIDDPEARERRLAAVKEGETLAKKRSVEEVVTAVGTAWWSTPGFVARGITGSEALPPADSRTRDVLMGDYETIFSRRFAETRDTATAHQQTVELLRTKWARSEVNDGQLMLRAPEREYPAVGGSHAWMKTQLEADLVKVIGPRMQKLPASLMRGEMIAGPSVRAWDYSLVPDRATEAEAASGKPPSYNVVVLNNITGKRDLLYDKDGRPMRYRWDATPFQETSRANFSAERTRVLNPPSIDLSQAMR